MTAVRKYWGAPCRVAPVILGLLLGLPAVAGAEDNPSATPEKPEMRITLDPAATGPSLVFTLINTRSSPLVVSDFRGPGNCVSVSKPDGTPCGGGMDLLVIIDPPPAKLRLGPGETREWRVPVNKLEDRVNPSCIIELPSLSIISWNVDNDDNLRHPYKSEAFLRKTAAGWTVEPKLPPSATPAPSTPMPPPPPAERSSLWPLIGGLAAAGLLLAALISRLRRRARGSAAKGNPTSGSP